MNLRAFLFLNNLWFLPDECRWDQRFNWGIRIIKLTLPINTNFYSFCRPPEVEESEVWIGKKEKKWWKKVRKDWAQCEVIHNRRSIYNDRWLSRQSGFINFLFSFFKLIIVDCSLKRTYDCFYLVHFWQFLFTLF